MKNLHIHAWEEQMKIKDQEKQIEKAF